MPSQLCENETLAVSHAQGRLLINKNWYKNYTKNKQTRTTQNEDRGN